MDDGFAKGASPSILQPFYGTWVVLHSALGGQNMKSRSSQGLDR